MQEASLKQYVWAADSIRHKIDSNQLDPGTTEITDSTFTRNTSRQKIFESRGMRA